MESQSTPFHSQNASSFEREVVSKQNSSVAIFGCHERDVQWASIASEFIAHRFACNAKYSGVMCVTFDRPLSKEVITSISTMPPNASPCPGDNPDNLRFLDASLPTLDAQSMVNALEKSVEKMGARDTNLPVAAIFFGFSELVLRWGVRHALSFLEELISPSKPKSSIKFVVVAVIHTSLHSSQTIDLIKRFVSVVVMTQYCNISGKDVNSSTGFLESVRKVAVQKSQGSEIVQIQTIRKSSTSGRVSEDTELFGYDFKLSRLVPLARNCDKSSSESSESTSAASVSANDSQNSVYSALKDLKLEGGVANGRVDDLKLQQQQQQQQTQEQHRPLIVTFDNDDPEFDDDEDPDADLDL